MANTLRSEGAAGDVALFIDWENIKRSVVQIFGRMPDLSAMKKAAMQFGRLAVAKAYANWQDGQHQNDCEILYNQGIDPVFVATRRGVSSDTKEAFIKNSADVRMAIECVQEVLLRDNLHTVVLASGDGSMLHVVNLVKSLGKQVVVMAVSGSFTPPLTYLAHRFVLYDDLIAGFSFQGKGREEQIQEAMDALAHAVHEIRADALENTFPVLKTLIRRHLRDFEEETLGFPKFEYFVFRAEKEGHVRADVRGWQQTVYRGDETRSLTGKPLFGPQEWGWLITQLKKGPRFEDALKEAIDHDKVVGEVPGAVAVDLIHAAIESGVIVRHRELRYYPRSGGKAPHLDLRLNELNSRVQVYLGLEMKPAMVMPPSPVPAASQAAPLVSAIQHSLTERYRTSLRKAGLKAIALSRRERVEILRLWHDFLGKPQGEQPYREQIEAFLAICSAMNPAWTKSRVRSLVNLVFRSECLTFQGDVRTSPASLVAGLSVEELVRKCDMSCLMSLLGREATLDLTQAAAVLLDAEQHVDELKSVIQDMLRVHRVREEGSRFVLVQQRSSVAEDNAEDGEEPAALSPHLGYTGEA
jgi:uncharacterized protein (TIGR00288 family)